MESWKDRVFDERTELSHKIAALIAFINTDPAFDKLDLTEQTLLRAQLSTMQAYSHILTLRLNR